MYIYSTSYLPEDDPSQPHRPDLTKQPASPQTDDLHLLLPDAQTDAAGAQTGGEQHADTQTDTPQGEDVNEKKVGYNLYSIHFKSKTVNGTQNVNGK